MTPRVGDAVVDRLLIAGLVLLAAVPSGCDSADRGRDPAALIAGGTTGPTTAADRRAARDVLEAAWSAWRQGDARDAVDVIVNRLAESAGPRRAGLVAALRIEATAGDAAAWRSDPSESGAPASRVPGVPGWVAAASEDAGPATDRDRRRLSEWLGSIAGGGTGSVGRVVPRVRPEDAAAARMRFERAAAAIAAGRSMQAVVDLQEAGRLDPTQASIPRSLARVAEGLGNVGLARRAWQDVLSIDPADPDGLLALAADALRSDRPLAALALLQRLDPSVTGVAASAAVAASDAWCRDALLLEACERLGADAAMGDVAERMLASGADVDAARRAALGRNLPEAAIGRLGVARRLGDARWRAGRPTEAEAAYAIAADAADAAAASGGSATDRRERAAVLVRRVALAAVGAGHPDLGRLLREAAEAAPDDASPLVLAMELLEPSPASVRVLGAVAAATEPSVAARATAATPAWPAAGRADEPVAGSIAFGPVRRIERLHPDGPPWPHPLPEAADVAARRLLRARRPLSADRPADVSSPVHAAILEACGWIGRAHATVDRAVRLAEAEPGGTATVERTAALVMRIRLAGLLQEPEELARVIAEAREVPMPSGWAIRREMAAAMAHARIGRLDAAVRTAEDLVAAVDAEDAEDVVAAAGEEDAAAAEAAGDAADTAALAAAARLTLAAALVERAAVVGRGPEAGRDLRTAIELASAVRQSRPEDAAAWMLVEAVLAPTGPVPDPAAAARQRRQWTEVADRLPVAGPEADRLERARLMAAGRFAAVDDAARLRLVMDPLDETAIEDLLTARARAGRGEEGLRWLDRRTRRHPADPAAAAARLRSDAEAGRAMEAWARLERRLAADPDDLVALRLSEAAAGFAGDRMMQLVMAESRLLERPAGPHRALLLARASDAAGQSREALRSLRAFVGAAASASERDLAAAASLLSRIRGGDESSPAGSTETARAAMALERALAEAVLPRLGPGVPTPAGASAAATDERIVIGGMAAAIAGGEPSSRLHPWVDRLAGHAAGRGGSDVDAWRNLATASLAIGRGSDAAALIIRRVLRGPEPAAEVAPLLRLAVATDAAATVGSPDRGDAAAGEAAGEATESLLEALAAAGRLPIPEDGATDPLAEAFREAALVHRWLGTDAGARRLLAAALERRPDDALLLNDLGYARLEAAIASDRVVGEDPSIAGLIERAHDRDAANPAILDSLGWLRYRQGRIAGGPGDALDLLERADGSGDAPSAEVRLHLGDARWRAGRREAAAEAWAAASSMLSDPAAREGFEREARRLQLETWGALVRDPAAMYDSRFGRISEALGRRLEAWRSGADAIPVAPTDAEVAPAGDGP